MTRSLLACLAVSLFGCSAAAHEREPSRETSSGGELSRDASRAELDRRRIQDLEAHLAMTTDELRRAHIALSDARAQCDAATEEEPEPDEEAGGPRPILRLYGPVAQSVAPGPEAPPVLLPPPEASGLGPLPVVAFGGEVPALPLEPRTIAPAATAPPPPPRIDPAVAEYEAALALLEQRRFPEATAAFQRFTHAHPEHPYADNALHWQAEILYAHGSLRQAMALWQRLLERYPRGNRVPDALLRVGLCLERLGEPARARAFLDRLIRDYPESVAARMAHREDT